MKPDRSNQLVYNPKHSKLRHHFRSRLRLRFKGWDMLSASLSMVLTVVMALSFAFPPSVFADDVSVGNGGNTPTIDGSISAEWPDGSVSGGPAPDTTTPPPGSGGDSGDSSGSGGSGTGGSGSNVINIGEPGGGTAAANGGTAAAEDGSPEAVTVNPMAAPPAGGFDINLPLGGGTVDAGTSANIHIFGEGHDEVFPGTQAGLISALNWLATNANWKSYVLYIGSNIAVNDAVAAAFYAITDIEYLVITGTLADPVIGASNYPEPATSASGMNALTGGTNITFRCSVYLRNIAYGANNIYVSGKHLTLGHKSWATSATSYYGGAASGDVNGTPNITVWSTGSGISNFVGGMQTGTLTGNTFININNTSGNVFNVYGAGRGASASNRATLVGNATTNINGMASGTSGTGGLDHFLGGGEYCDVQGTITNNISGPGRFISNGSTYTYAAGSVVLGGSRVGNIGLDSAMPAYDANGFAAADGGQSVITSNFDFGQFTIGSATFMGANYDGGIIKGNVRSTVRAGTNGKGNISSFSGGAGYGASIGGSWSSTFSTQSSNGTVGNIAAGQAAAKAAAAFQMYGNIYTYIRSGCISNGTEAHYFRGAGWGYYEGNAYSELGTEGLVWKDNYAGGDANALDGGDITSMYNADTTHTSSATAGNRQGVVTAFDLVGGGGNTSGDNSFFIKGKTSLLQKNTRARWTYGGSFGGVHIGDSLNSLERGIVDTLEGSGYDAQIQVGDSRAEVHGGQVDWFLSGGGWDDDYHMGNASIEVYDNPRLNKSGQYLDRSNAVVSEGQAAPAAVVNASMGGTFGNTAGHYISGNASVTVHGGDFSGTAGRSIGQNGSDVLRGFSAGPSNEGTIFGNTSMTMDLRGNRYGFYIESGDSISGARRLGAPAASRTGTNANNTITLNVFADASAAPSLLNGLNIYGDASSGTQTRAGHVIMNINAPGAVVGTVIATNYTNISGSGASAQIAKNVEINLVSAGQLQGLTSGGMWGTGAAQRDNITNTIVAASTNRATLNVGPQASTFYYPTGNIDPITGEDLLADWEPGLDSDGYPRRINVAGNGISNFTSMAVNNRLLIAESGNILNGGGATTANHAATYNNFGDIVLADNSGLGVAGGSARFIAGKLTINGTGYALSPGARDQITISDVEFGNAASRLTWLKASGSVTLTTGLDTTWFGVTSGWPVITLNSSVGGVAAAGRANADKLTPANFLGKEMATGQTYIGDNDQQLSATDGYGVCIPGSFYTWNVVPGPDGTSLGKISYNIAGSFNMGTTKPSGGSHLDAYGTSPMNTPSASGSIAIPSDKVPSPVGYPEFTFIPDSLVGEWIKDLTIQRSDHFATTPNGLYDYHDFEQPLPDYDSNDPDAQRFVWQSAASGRPTGYYSPTGSHGTLPSGQDDKDYSFDITVDYTNIAQLTGKSVYLFESDAVAQFDAALDSATPGTRFATLKSLTNAAGRPFFKLDGSQTAEPTAKLNQIGTALGDLPMREVSFTLESGNTALNAQSKTILVVVVPDDTPVWDYYSLIANNSTIRFAQAQAINGQAAATVAATQADPTKLDYFSGAHLKYIGEDSSIPNEQLLNLSNAAAHVSAINSVATVGLVESLPYWVDVPDDKDPTVLHRLDKTVTATVIAGNAPFVLFNGKYDPAIPDADRDPLKTYATEPLSFDLSLVVGSILTDAQLLAGVSGWDVEDGNITTTTLSGYQDISYALPGGLTAIPADKVGVYQVSYSVTDKDNNTVTRTRAVSVGVTWDDGYGIIAKHFVYGLSLATATGSEILGLSAAIAYDVEGNPATPKLTTKGSYTNAIGSYNNIVIGVDGLVYDEASHSYRPTTASKTITGQVLDDHAAGAGGAHDPGGYSYANGTDYSIYAGSFRITKSSALTLQTNAAGNISSPYIRSVLTALSAPQSKQRLTTPFANNGGWEAVSISNSSLGSFLTADPDQISNGLVFEVVLRSAEESATTITVKMLINTGSLPVLTVPMLKTVEIGQPFPEGQYDDVTPSYMQGVMAIDLEDSALAIPLVVTHDNPVNTSVPGYYTVTYSVTDAEGNTVTKQGLVLVNDDTYSVNYEYLLRAYNFVASVDEVNQAAALGSLDDLIVEASFAEAWHIVYDVGPDYSNIVITPLPVTVTDDGGLAATPGSYAPIKITPYPVVPASANVVREVTGKVVDKDAIDRGTDTSSLKYTVAGNSIGVPLHQAADYADLGAAAKASIITAMAAEGYVTSAITIGGPGSDYVDVLSNELTSTTTPTPNAVYKVVLYPKGVPGAPASPEVSIELNITILASGEPIIEFVRIPLVVQQASSSQLMTDAELKQYVLISDLEDMISGYPTALVAQPLDESGLPLSGGIDKSKIGVYKVRYTATDEHGNSVVAYRAVVVTDGRYVIPDYDNDHRIDSGHVIIGARNFVVRSADADASFAAIRSLSYAEAFDKEGTDLSGSLYLPDGMPTGYTTATAALGDYPFKWRASGYPTEKPITGTVVDATVVDPGDKNSQYAIVASDFQVNTAEALAIITVGDPAFITAADARVYKLVAGVPDKQVELDSQGDFTDMAGIYNITYVIEGIPATSQKAVIVGTVSNGAMPNLVVQTPIVVWVGNPTDPERTAGSILPAEYSEKVSVTVTDVEEAAKGQDLTLDDVIVSYPGIAVPAVLDVDAVGNYQVRFEVTDTDNNKVIKNRVVVVNDGRYKVETGRSLRANPFVIRAQDVTTTESLVDTQLLSQTDALLLDNTTNVSYPSDRFISARGGYSPTPGTYSVIVGGRGGPLPSPASGNYPDILKTVKAEVVDAEVIETGPDDPNKPNYFIYGNNIQLTPLEAQAIINTADKNAALITALDAGARVSQPNGNLATLAVAIDNDSSFLSRDFYVAGVPQNLGEYNITVRDNGSHISAVLKVTVGVGALPQIHFNPDPLVFDIVTTPGNLSTAQLMTGVTATDVEDDDDGTPLVVTIVGTPAIPRNSAGVTPVTYTVTDSAGNRITAIRAAVVNDGSIILGTSYILRAHSFVIHANDVDVANRDSQIKLLSEAEGWTIRGTNVSVARVAVTSSGGYTATVGDYNITIGMLDEPSLSRTINAKVYQDDEGFNGDRYSILGNHFRLNYVDANAAKALSSADMAALFASRADIKSYLRSGMMGNQAGTKVMTSDGGFRSHGNFSDANEGRVFPVTFWVDEDHTATVTIDCLISRGSLPVLTVPRLKEVPLGTAISDVRYREGVLAYDSEDRNITSRVTYNATAVDINTEGVYPVVYSVTDSDHNTVTKTSHILVNGGNWVIGNEYMIYAHNFTTDYTNVNGTDDEIIERSGAIALKIEDMVEVRVVVLDRAGYRRNPGSYPNIKLAPQPEQATVRSIMATLTGSLPNPSQPPINIYQPPLPPNNITIITEAPPAATYNIVAPQTPLTQIDNTEPPKSAPVDIKGWSLMNVLLTIALALLLVGYIVKYLLYNWRSREDEDETMRYEFVHVNIAVLIIAGAALVEAVTTLFLTQDFAGPVATFDLYTVVFGFMLAIALVAPVLMALIVNSQRSQRYQQLLAERSYRLPTQIIGTPQ